MLRLIRVPGIAIALCLLPFQGKAQETQVSPTEMVEFSNLIIPFLTALKNGDVQTIKSSLSRDMYLEYKTLLEQNQDYPRFLIEYYKDADLSISDIVRVGKEKNVVVKIKLQFAGRPSEIIEVDFSRSPLDSSLKVGRLREGTRRNKGSN